MQWWYKIWQLSGYNPAHVRQQTSQETQKSPKKFLEPTRKPKVIHTDNSLEFGKSCEELSWNHCAKTHRDYISSVQKSCPVCSSALFCVRVESGKEIADIEELEEMVASEIHARRLNGKEVLTPMKGNNFYIPSRRWNSQSLWRRSTSETIHLNQGSP